MRPVITEEEFNERLKVKEKEVGSLESFQKGVSPNDDLEEYKRELRHRFMVCNEEQIKSIEKEENVWEVYDGIDNLSKDRKDEIVFFFRGYLQYYDQVTRNNAINHLLHFRFEEKKGRVIVYICPKPARVYNKPETCPPGTASFSSDPVPPKAPPPPY